MSTLWIVILVILAVLLGLFYLGYYIFSEKEKYFRKHLQVGDMCLFYLNEYEDKLCHVIEINDDIVRVKDRNGDIYKTNIENITAP